MASLTALDLRVVRDADSGCLRWQGAHTPKGYGQIYLDGKAQAVHRVAYERAFGPIPDGLEVDHVRAQGCVHRDCIEPAHLEAVTHAENVQRRPLPVVCGEGHPYVDGSYLTKVTASGSSYRVCLPCRTAYKAEYRKRVLSRG